MTSKKGVKLIFFFVFIMVVIQAVFRLGAGEQSACVDNCVLSLEQ